ncbi:MAG: DUF6240 domain-containing protein [Lachnospiraceae bacterium]
MKISFDWNEQKREAGAAVRRQENTIIKAGGSRAGVSPYNQTILDISGKVTDNFSFGNQGGFNQKVIQEVGVEQYMLLQRNFNVVMSNSMSGKDFMAMDKEGFDVYSMEPEEAVTILDKIKAVLAQSGTEITGYNDSLSQEDLEQITGSRAYANKIARALEQADAPVTEENIRQIEEVVAQAQSLERPGEGNMAYLAANGLELTLSNLYKAGYSSMNVSVAGNMAGYATGSYTRQGENTQDIRRTQVSKEELSGLEEQLKERIKDSGLEPKEDKLNAAKWLMEKGLPIDRENLELVKEVQDMQFPLDEEMIIQRAAQALAQGKSPRDISLTENMGSIYAQATEICERYQRLPLKAADYASVKELPLTLENMEGYYEDKGNYPQQIQARKTLEEIRLKMTVEANLKLLQSGFSIDTAPMEELITRLDEAARQWEQSLFGDTASAGKGQLYLETLNQLEELPRMPVDLVGRIPSMESPTLRQLGEEGRLLQSRYHAAREEYETLMTAPRRDMGDSIHKAFQNVDNLLEDMALETTEENRRAIRILGYNSMEITRENFLKVQAADRQVQEVIEGMKPGLTLEMIRQGKNPMEMTLDELQDYIHAKDAEFGQDTSKYSSFLYKLEKQGNISEDERKAYIGIYRLFRQIEKSDGAVIGSLVSQGADLNLSNLLSAVRSRKARPTDIRIDDTVGTLKELKTTGTSISSQIEEGFAAIRQQLGNEKSLEQLAREMERIAEDKQLGEQLVQENLEEIRQILDKNAAEADYLKAYHQPVTIDNLQSAGVLNEERGKTFGRIRTLEEKFLADQDGRKRQPEFLEKAERFIEQLDQPEERDEAYEAIIEEAGQVLENAVSHTENEMTYVDLKGIQQLYKQLHLASDLAREENYEIPVQIGEELTSINLKIIHRAEALGEVKITLNTEALGKVEARFKVSANFLEGSVLTQYMDKKNVLQGQESLLTDAINEALEGTEIQMKGILFGENKNLNINLPETGEETVNPDTALLYRIAKEFIAFIRKA